MPITLPIFLQYAQKYQLLPQGKRILLAFSGGVDSVVLAHLLKEAGAEIALAHCNFQLRGDESDADEQFTLQTANKLGVKAYTTKFDTEKYLKQNKLSVQMAARELRYNWFRQLMEENGYYYLATAHHQTDNVETILLNMLRGTGIAGLQGIKPIEVDIIRPLLFATKDDIVEYAKGNKLGWHEDSSNATNNYSRNKLRNVVLPVLRSMNPSLEETFGSLSELAIQYRDFIKDTIAKNTANITEYKKGELHIHHAKLQLLGHNEVYLYELLKDYGFKNDSIPKIAEAMQGHTGAIFRAGEHELLIDREYLIVRKAEEIEEEGLYISQTTNSFEFAGRKYKVRLVNANTHTLMKDPRVTQLDAEKLYFPVRVRGWEKGDYFYPLGLKKKKKVSDYFIDAKVNLFEKQAAPLLFSNNKLVSVVGHRIDERYKITKKTKKILVVRPADN